MPEEVRRKIVRVSFEVILRTVELHDGKHKRHKVIHLTQFWKGGRR